MIPAVLIFAGLIATGASILHMGEIGASPRAFLAGMFGICLMIAGASVLVGGA